MNGFLVLIFAGVWVWIGTEGLFWRGDFSAFYTGYTLIVEGRGERLYDLNVQAEQQLRLLPDWPLGDGLLPFVYPPHAAVALAPLGLLRHPAAFALWSMLQLGMCLLLGRFLFRLLSDQGAGVRWLTLVSVLAFPPLFTSFQLGQVSLWCLVCQFGFVCALKERRPLAVAVWLLAGTVKPQLMVVPGLVLLGLRRWRELVWFAVLLGISGGLATVLLGPGCWLDYLRLLRVHSQGFGSSTVDPLIMYNVKGLLTAQLGDGRHNLINLFTLGAWLASVVLVLWLWRDSGSLDRPDWRGRLTLSFMMGMLVNPHLNPVDALGLVLPAVLFLGQLQQDGERRQATTFAALAVCCPLLFLIDCWGLRPARLGFRPFFALELGLLGWMALVLWSPRPRAVPAPSSAVPVLNLE
jgi:hypothetical protein